MERNAFLVLDAAPAVEPLTTAECKAQMAVDFADDDAYIATLISAAVALFDGQGALGKAMITQTWQQFETQSPGTVTLRMCPVQSVTEIGYFDTNGNSQTATLSDFDVFGTPDRKTVAPKAGKSWPTAQDRPDAIWIKYTAGYGNAATDVPATILAAMKLTVAHWYEQREAATVKKMSDLPIGVEALIGTERARWFG